MIKETLLASAFGLLGLVTVACGSQKKDLMAGTDYVNPFIGASTNTEAAGAYHGLGKTFRVRIIQFDYQFVTTDTVNT